jgi:hypothetical protein
MALRPLNSVGGFSVGEIPANVILANADLTVNNGTFSGNLLISNANASWGVLTDNLYYSNGVPWDLQEAAGSNTQIQYNDGLNNFGASANFTYDDSSRSFVVLGNAQFNNANLGNLAIANFVNVASNTTTGNLTVNNNISGNTANFSGNVVVPNLAVNLELAGNTANFSGNISALNANLGNLVTANYVNVSQQINGNVGNFSGNINANNANIGSGNIDLYANGEIAASTANFTGNVYAAYFVGNVSANVTVTAANTTVLFSNAGLIDGSANFTFDHATNELYVNGNANVTGNIDVGGILTDNYYYANGAPVDFQQAAGSNTQIQYNSNGDFGASANFTFDDATNTLTVSGNANITTVNTSNVVGTGTDVTINANGYVSTFHGANGLANLAGGLTANGNLSVLNANLGNLAIANYINVASNVVTSNLTVNLQLDGNVGNFSGNVSALNANLGNLATANYVNVSQQINGNVANFSGNLTAQNANLGNLATANYVNVANDLNVTGNINAGNLVGPLANGNSNIRIFQNANLEFSSNGVANVVTITNNALLVAGNIQATTGNVLANGNVTANGFLVGANASVTGEAAVGSLLTANITATTTDITISASGTDGTINLVPTGNGTVDVSGFKITQVGGPVNPTDAATKEYVDAMAGEGLDIHTPVRVESPTALNATYAQGGTTQTTTDISGGKTITFSANHGLSVNDGIVWTNSFNGIVGGEAYWVQTVPALNQITIRDGYFGAEVTTLTNGTGLSQASRANPGVGATLTNAGANAALQIDGINLSNTNRVLVYTQTNAYENGVYVVSDAGNSTAAWVLTRASDFDKYIPDSSLGLSKGSYVFVTEGATGAGESYVMTQPIGEVIIGTDNITFTQFSAAGSYTAGNGIAINGTTISANVDNITTAIVSGNIVVKAGANLTTPNLGDATFSSLSWNTLSNGNVTANNLSIGNIANITLDLTVGGNIQANGTISSNANVSGLNLTTSGNVQATGNVLANNLTANTLLTTPTANVSNVVNAGNVSIVNNLAGNTANFSGNVVVPNLTVNLELAGNTANFSGAVIVTGNLSSGNANLGNLAVANFFSGDGGLLTNVSASGSLSNGNSSVTIPVADGNVLITVDGNANIGVFTGTGANINGYLTASGNLSGANASLGNLATANYVNVSSNIVTSNLTVNLELAGNTANFSGNVVVPNLSVNLALAGNTANFSGAVIAQNVTANSTVFAANANVSGTTITNELTVNNAITGNTANFAGNIVVNNATVNLELSGNTANFSGNVVAPNLTVNLELAGNTANFTGNLVAANLVTSGTANVANLNVTANVTSDLLPNANLTYDLGSSSQRWDNLYAGNIDAAGNITSTGNLSANNFTANTFVANTAVEVGNTAIEWGTVTTTSISAGQIIAQAPYSGVTGVDFIVKGTDTTGAKYSMAHVTAVTDGSNVDYTTYGTVFLGSSTGTLSVAISGSNIVLQVTPSSSNSTVWTTQYRLI